MMNLTNKEREHLGLDPIDPQWEFIELKEDQYRPKSILVFNGDTIKRHIIRTEDSYIEKQCDVKTKNRNILLPKTKRGKEKKLTAATFEKVIPIGVYLDFSFGQVTIANFSTDVTFYSTKMEMLNLLTINDFKKWLHSFIEKSNDIHLRELNKFKIAKRKNVKPKSGDIFAFKIDRTNYGYGQILENIDSLRKGLDEMHGLKCLMGKPLLVNIYHYKSKGIELDIDKIKSNLSTPSQYIFDNRVFYGEYPILGNSKIEDSNIDFPISYGRTLDISKEVYLQWGLIHKQKPLLEFNKYLEGRNIFVNPNSINYLIRNPHSNNGVGFDLNIDSETLNSLIKTKSNKPYWDQKIFTMDLDLRNPINRKIKEELFLQFDLNPTMNYIENKSKML